MLGVVSIALIAVQCSAAPSCGPFFNRRAQRPAVPSPLRPHSSASRCHCRLSHATLRLHSDTEHTR